MRLREEDINFLKLDGREFEEMCFDLLRRLGFHSMVWRQRGADQGRDIEGFFTNANPVVGVTTERWFFECKNQVAGVAVADLADKIIWADAEKPDHFVVLAGSHLTNDCRTWLEKSRADKRYRLHAVEGKELNRLLRCYPRLVERFFAGPYVLLLRDLIRQFLLLGLLPSPEQLHSLWANLEPAELAPEELAFLWSAWRLKEDEVDAWSQDNEEFSFSHYVRFLLEQARPGRPLLEGKAGVVVVTQIRSGFGGMVFEVESDGRLGRALGSASRSNVLAGEAVAQIILDSTKRPYPGLYAYVATDESEALEVLVEGGRSLTAAIRRIRGEFDKDQNASLALLKRGNPNGVPSMGA